MTLLVLKFPLHINIPLAGASKRVRFALRALPFSCMPAGKDNKYGSNQKVQKKERSNRLSI